MGGRIALWLAFGALAACQGTEATPFPPGLEPLEENTAPAPEGTEGDPFPEAIEVVTGETDDFVWAHGRMYIHADADAVWAALSDPDVIVNERESDSHSFTLDIEPEYEHSFQIHYVVNQILTVEWDENWRYGAVETDEQGIFLGAIRWQKVYGSTFIRLIEGSATLERIDDGITMVEMIEHVDAVTADADNIDVYMHDLFDNLVARRKGEPLPSHLWVGKTAFSWTRAIGNW